MTEYDLTIAQVCALLKLKPWAIYNNIRKFGFPKPKKFNPRIARWSKAEIEAWIEARPQ